MRGLLSAPALCCATALMMAGCGGPGSEPEVAIPPGQELSDPVPGGPGEPLPYPQVEDHVRHDTLLIQITFDLGDGTHVMVASHVQETFEGLRLYRYRVLPDSQAMIIKASAPAYDSWTMLPTFFRHPHDSTAWIVLANLGERQSWGQKVFRLDAEGFAELGFLDVALPVELPEEDGGSKVVGIGADTRVHADGDGILFRFTAARLHLFDDLEGGHDQVLDAGRVAYRWDPVEGMVLWVDGRVRKPKA